MDFIVPKILYWQLFVTPQLPQATFEGQTVIVTGGNAGLGLEAVRHFVKMDAKRVVLACRTTSKGEEAKADIETSTGRKGVVKVMQLDLASYDSVKRFAARVNAFDRLDVLVENAGISVAKFERFEGEESTITVNVISTFLLALLILPKLQESATRYEITPRLCIVASEVHYMADLKKELQRTSIFDALSDEKLAPMGFNRYSQSKLLEVLYCRALAPRMNQHGKPWVTLNYINPGLCHSNLIGDRGRIADIFKAVFARSADVGARTEIAGAAAGKDSHGKFINNGVISEPSSYVRSSNGAVAGQRLFDELNVKLEKISPGITNAF